MPKDAQGTSVPSSLLRSAYLDSIDTADLAMDSLSRLGDLFCVVKKLAPDNEEVQTVADVGQYLADDWWSVFCDQGKAYQAKWEGLQ